jgi:hypothetical protein
MVSIDARPKKSFTVSTMTVRGPGVGLVAAVCAAAGWHIANTRTVISETGAHSLATAMSRMIAMAR